MLEGKEYVCWICQGSLECRRENKIIQLFGNTSKATKHLGEKHLLAAGKITAEITRGRDRAEELERIRCAIAGGTDSRRMTLLLETMRVGNSNLPFRIGEYDESELLADLVVPDEFRATINNHTVTRAIAELYSSARQAIRSHLERSRVNNMASFSMVDSGPDVKWMMTKGIGLQWEWCMPYLTNAATNTAFGIALQRKASKNFPATDLVSRIASTTFAVRSNA
ncbi:hypothetical protein F441_02875 [Phytophthora nicotianae CJ01A1]|uniref:Uncharacterized protein n=1 Tax=Phytophthora nicotianae CJ01A1 TaxID=1317063 RepID=W2XN23_PHYNI|nr:hypothetical protein F441_02875 [Phytophthora nicotianae CJ01A1]